LVEEQTHWVDTLKQERQITKQQLAAAKKQIKEVVDKQVNKKAEFQDHLTLLKSQIKQEVATESIVGIMFVAACKYVC
jgi:site-specific recombinase XerC